MSRKPSVLVLANGSVFRGYQVGYAKEAVGEAVFNTSLFGYQEIISDPSYSGQLIIMTAPQIGNTGVNQWDMESERVHCAGLVTRELSPSASSWRSEASLAEFLLQNEVPAIDGIDTRSLTRVLRSEGAMMGMISDRIHEIDRLIEQIQAVPCMEGQDLASQASCREGYLWEEPVLPSSLRMSDRAPVPIEFEVVAYDFGIKKNILRDLRNVGCRVQVVPATTPAREVLARGVDGIFLSNGPGDPMALEYAVESARELASSGVPLFGICLGHQVLSLALGAKTYKLPFGHHGGNHPVMDLQTGKVEITAHNHGFSVEQSSLKDDVRCTHRNLNDDTVEGIEWLEQPVFGVQYHPEGGPGPHDAVPLFHRFAKMMRSVK